MIRIRPTLGFLLAAALIPSCEPTAEDAPVALAGLGLPAATASGEETWQSTVTRRVRWGAGTDDLVAPFPDGRRMAVTDWGTGDMTVYDLETGDTTYVTQQPAPYVEGIAMFPAVSPDGERIAYSWEDMRENMLGTQLREVSTDGGAAKLLYRGPPVPWIHATDWSHDGSLVLVNRGTEETNEIAVVSTADGAATVLKTLGPRDVWVVRFSPDDRFIAYDYPTSEDTDDRDIFILAADGGGESVLVDGPADDRLLGWAPDGRYILFLSDRAGTPGAWLIPVEDGRAAGEPYLVKPDMWAVEPIGFSADGRFFYAVGVGARAMHEVTFTADGRALATAPVDLSSRTHRAVLFPRWSPDGQYIAFATTQEGRPPVLRVRSSESGEEREVRLDRRVGFFYDLEWMPDGRSLAAVVDEESGRRPAVMIDVRTGETTTLVQPERHDFVSGITVSPDGRTLYYSLRHFAETIDDARERIMSHDLATGAEQLLHENGNPPRRIRSLAVSPDGATLVFQDGMPEDSRIRLLSATGGTARAIADGWSTSMAWTPDGGAILLQRYGPDRAVDSPARLERLDIATGETVPLGLERDALGVYGRFDFHPDGRRALFTAGAPQSEWWVMEGFLGDPRSPGRGSSR